jgi:molybdopterin molybdotransferase
VKAAFDWPAGKRQEYLRVRLEQNSTGPVAKIFLQQGSGVLSSVCWADGLVEIPIDVAVKQGDLVSYLPFV